MSLTLVRIDDRLVHGQVTVGWGSILNPDRIVLVSDEIAADEWQKELYQNCVPFSINISILSVVDAANAFLSGSFDKDRVILLTENPHTIVELYNNGLIFQQVNIGGMHQKPNKIKILPYIFVDNSDIQEFNFLTEHNVELVCQELPQAKKEDLAELLKSL